MSNYDASMDNATELYERGDETRGRVWTAKAAGFLREEYLLAGHLLVTACQNVGATQMECTRCKERVLGSTIPAMLRFRDQHLHCKEPEIDVWTCRCCGNGLMMHEEHCRFCWTPQSDHDLVTREPSDVVGQLEEYGIYDQHGKRLAEVEAPNLLMARRAARALFVREDVRVRMDNYDGHVLEWDAYPAGAGVKLI